MWTNIFEPPPLSPSTPSSSTPSLAPSSSPTPSTLPSLPPAPPSSPPSSLSSSVTVGSIIGSLIGGFLLSVICFLLYKWNKNRQEQKNRIPTPGSEGNYNNQNLNFVIPTKGNYNQGQEIVPPNLLSVNEHGTDHEPIYNHGREVANNER